MTSLIVALKKTGDNCFTLEELALNFFEDGSNGRVYRFEGRRVRCGWRTSDWVCGDRFAYAESSLLVV